MGKIDNLILTSKHNNRPFIYDVHLPNEKKPHPVIIFCHGFKGFKDWGHFDLIAQKFANNGFTTFKLNFSHNGTTPESPVDFTDLEAFGHNNFTIELDDLDELINKIITEPDSNYAEYIDSSKIFLVGHSKGGSTSIIKACEDSRVKGLSTWAAVCHIMERYSQDEMGEWKKNGVQYVYNGRTEQNMPLYYQLAEDVLNNKERFNIPKIVKAINKPFLIVHGDADQSVLLSEGEALKQYHPEAKLVTIPEAEHTFGGGHPWSNNEIPKHTIEAINTTIKFFQSNL